MKYFIKWSWICFLEVNIFIELYFDKPEAI